MKNGFGWALTRITWLMVGIVYACLVPTPETRGNVAVWGVVGLVVCLSVRLGFFVGGWADKKKE